LLNPKFENTAFDVTGPALIGTADIAAAASAISGKRIELVESVATVPGAPPAGGMMMIPATVSNAVAELSGRPGTGVRALLEANKDKLLAVAK
jgi:hypothetical protein